MLKQLEPVMAEWLSDTSGLDFTQGLIEQLGQGVDEELSGIDQSALASIRDALLRQLLQAKATASLP